MRRASAARLPLPLRVFFLASFIFAFAGTQLVAEREAHADFFSVWGEIHGGYLTGMSDRFDEGSQGFFGFAGGFSITVVDIFIDVRMDGFDLETAGMWNQLGAGVSFGFEVAEDLVEILVGVRVAYLYAQFSDGARKAFEEKFVAGDREQEPSQKGLNISAQAGVDVTLIGPLYFNAMVDIGYHVLLPAVTDDHGLNFSALGGIKLKFGF